MENVKKYKKIIRQILEFRASLKVSNAPELERHLIMNEDQTEFVLISFGWNEKNYRHSFVFHIEIKKDKIWVHEDNTDLGIAAKLAENGIPKSDIILGFLPQYAREISGYAVA